MSKAGFRSEINRDLMQRAFQPGPVCTGLSRAGRAGGQCKQVCRALPTLIGFRVLLELVVPPSLVLVCSTNGSGLLHHLTTGFSPV